MAPTRVTYVPSPSERAAIRDHDQRPFRDPARRGNEPWKTPRYTPRRPRPSWKAASGPSPGHATGPRPPPGHAREDRYKEEANDPRRDNQHAKAIDIEYNNGKNHGERSGKARAGQRKQTTKVDTDCGHADPLKTSTGELAMEYGKWRAKTHDGRANASTETQRAKARAGQAKQTTKEDIDGGHADPLKTPTGELDRDINGGHADPLKNPTGERAREHGKRP